MSLISFLKQDGYTRIPLSRSGVGHFHADGLLNDRPISVLIDTGADSTVFSLASVQSIGLTMTKLSIQAAGAGSANLDIYQLDQARFIIGGLSPKTRDLLALDLSDVIQGLAQKGSSTPVDAILGVDVLESHSAVIDYASSSLFLKEQLQ